MAHCSACAPERAMIAGTNAGKGNSHARSLALTAGRLAVPHPPAGAPVGDADAGTVRPRGALLSTGRGADRRRAVRRGAVARRYAAAVAGSLAAEPVGGAERRAAPGRPGRHGGRLGRRAGRPRADPGDHEGPAQRPGGGGCPGTGPVVEVLRPGGAARPGRGRVVAAGPVAGAQQPAAAVPDHTLRAPWRSAWPACWRCW